MRVPSGDHLGPVAPNLTLLTCRVSPAWGSSTKIWEKGPRLPT